MNKVFSQKHTDGAVLLKRKKTTKWGVREIPTPAKERQTRGKIGCPNLSDCAKINP